MTSLTSDHIIYITLHYLHKMRFCDLKVLRKATMAIIIHMADISATKKLDSAFDGIRPTANYDYVHCTITNFKYNYKKYNLLNSN